MASATEQDADVLNSSSMQHTLVLDAQLPTVALSMHRVYHIVVAKSRISESLQAHLALGLRQEQEEDDLCGMIDGDSRVCFLIINECSRTVGRRVHQSMCFLLQAH